MVMLMLVWPMMAVLASSGMLARAVMLAVQWRALWMVTGGEAGGLQGLVPVVAFGGAAHGVAS